MKRSNGRDMKISKSHFDNDGEIDCTLRYKEGNKYGRVSIRKSKEVENFYEAYVFWFATKTEELLHRGTLASIVEFTNARFGLNDVVEEVNI